MHPALVLLPDFLLILCGFALRRSGFISAAFLAEAERFIYFILFPPLLFRALAHATLDIAASVPMLAAGLLFTVAAFLLGSAAKPLFKLPQPSFAAGNQGAYRFNSYVAFAVMGALAGEPGIATIALLCGAMVPIVNLFAVWQLAHGSGRGMGHELIRNPIIWGISSGLAANLAGLAIPAPLFAAISHLADAALPLGLITVGAGLRFEALRRFAAPLLYWNGIKLLVAPLIALAAAQLLGISGLYRQALLVMSMLPTATSAYILAVRMQGDGKLAAAVVTSSTLAAMLTMPLLLSWLQ
ncbi:AEC family transporter [Vogesella sp. GCM10023246]|uniref:AEC family transporter n=1 Tax=Vogesella oryzagri TaxID=3160864 RepID=A0ABV1M2J0_9NEIS